MDIRSITFLFLEQDMMWCMSLDAMLSLNFFYYSNYQLNIDYEFDILSCRMGFYFIFISNDPILHLLDLQDRAYFVITYL